MTLNDEITTTRLQELEQVIERGLMDVGQSLQEIRDKGLYKADYATFEDYCRERWGLTRRHVNRQIAAASVVSNLGPIGPKLPQTESQARQIGRAHV